MRHSNRSNPSNKPKNPKATLHAQQRDERRQKRHRDDIIRADGEIIETLGYENFRVTLDNGMEIKATPSGRIRLNHVRLMVGDRVELELSAYDLTRGRISRRFHVKQNEY